MKNLFLSFLLLLPLAVFALKPYTVTVYVKSLAGMKPIKGAEVKFKDKKEIVVFSMSTDEEGKVVFSNCTEKSFEIYCQAGKEFFTKTEYFDNKGSWDITTEMALRYTEKKEMEFLAEKMMLPVIDTTSTTPRQKGDSCTSNFKIAEYPGGKEVMVTYLQKNLIVPAVAEEKKISGKVYLKFAILTDGSISLIQIVQGIPDCPECDLEAVRVLAYMPKWIPASCDDTPLNQWYALPIVYNVR